ncbi:MAG: FAD-binding oxidoreductase, partial [Rhodocyclaceae bacterium]|nr:FAD-binding oxidoreductase [Rhodocyclaceae bacterium]
MEEVLEQLRASLGDSEVIDGAEVEARYLRDWSSAPGRRPLALVRPRSTAEVSSILSICSGAGVGVVAQGGMTGIAGAAIADEDQIAMSLERLRGIEEVDEAAATITAWAGTPIQLLQEAAREKGYLFALDWGARGTATVGGGLATNAGGNRVIRYGMAREHVLGIEAVLADGTVLSMMNKMQKNNA